MESTAAKHKHLVCSGIILESLGCAMLLGRLLPCIKVWWHCLSDILIRASHFNSANSEAFSSYIVDLNFVDGASLFYLALELNDHGNLALELIDHGHWN